MESLRSPHSRALCDRMYVLPLCNAVMSNSEYLVYFDTETQVKLGDIIKFKKLFKSVKGQVVYIPGQSKINPSFGEDTWAIQLDDEPGDVRSMVYAPDQENFAYKKIEFLCRGESDNAVGPDENII